MASALIALVGVLCSVHVAYSIKCWQCNSAYDPNCADPFDNYTFSLQDCDQWPLPHYPSMKASLCRKIVQKITDNYRTYRGCGFIPDEKEGLQCIKRAGTFNVLVQYCTCDSDGCNGAEKKMMSASSILGVVLPVLLSFTLF